MMLQNLQGHQRTAEGQDALLKLGGYAEAAADLINGHFRNVNSVAADQARWEAQLRKSREMRIEIESLIIFINYIFNK